MRHVSDRLRLLPKGPLARGLARFLWHLGTQEAVEGVFELDRPGSHGFEYDEVSLLARHASEWHLALWPAGLWKMGTEKPRGLTGNGKKAAALLWCRRGR